MGNFSATKRNEARHAIQAAKAYMKCEVFYTMTSDKTLNGETISPETPDEMAKLVPRIIADEANIVGGCGGTTPTHITRIREIVDRR